MSPKRRAGGPVERKGLSLEPIVHAVPRHIGGQGFPRRRGRTSRIYFVECGCLSQPLFDKQGRGQCLRFREQVGYGNPPPRGGVLFARLHINLSPLFFFFGIRQSRFHAIGSRLVPLKRRAVEIRRC